MAEWKNGTDELEGISRGETLIAFRERTAKIPIWALTVRETPTGIYMKARTPGLGHSDVSLTPVQADALEEFLARARKMRERIGSVDG